MNRSEKMDLESGSRIALFSIIKIGFLALLKAVFGYVTGYVVLTADALSSFADFLSLFAAYIGLRLSTRSATKNFKYGYYKAETLAALVAACVIIAFGIDILLESVQRITEPQEPEQLSLVFVSVVISIIASFHLASQLMKAGKRINSLALINNAKDKRMDVIVEIAVLVGAIAHLLHFPYLEGVVGVIISYFTLKLGAETAKESLFFLLDYFDDQEMMAKVRGIIMERSLIVKDIKDIRMRRAGTYIFGEAFLQINPYSQTMDIRNDLKRLKEAIQDTSPHLKDFLLFVDIPYKRNVMIAVPIKKDEGLQSDIATSFHETKAFAFVQVKNGKIERTHVRPFAFEPTDINGIKDYLTGEKINVIINNDMHSLLFYELRRLHSIDVYPSFRNVTSVENAVKLMLLDL